MEERTFFALESVLEDMEIRGVIYPFPSGPVEGYEWRYLVNIAANPPDQPRVEWTRWVFGSHQSVEKMLRTWTEYMQTQGHQTPGVPPGKSVQ